MSKLTAEQLAHQRSRLVFSREFMELIGRFHEAWTSLELLTDYAIYKFLKVTPSQGHLITAAMFFSRKARLLTDLIGNSDHPNKAAILGAFNKVRDNNKRDIIAHSYIYSDDKTVTFVERNVSGKFKAIEHKFAFEEFKNHVVTFMKNAQAFHDAFAPDYDDVQAFARAALSLNCKDKTSPGAPSDNA